MIDLLAEVVTMLQPSASFTKIVSGAGAWRVRRTEPGRTFYCIILEGTCLLLVNGHAPITLQEGDFVLIPEAHNFSMSSLEPPPESIVSSPIVLPNGEFRLGMQGGSPDVRCLIGYCVFGVPDVALLLSLLPKLVFVRGEKRLTTLVQLLGDECNAHRPARNVVLARLLEVLFVEALRSTTGATTASLSLLRGMADERLAIVIRRIHEFPSQTWTIDQLAKEAALSRSALFQRFKRVMGIAPMEYLLAWRMALAKNLLKHSECSISEVAERVGYSSVNTFSVAFTRHVGLPPRHYVVQNMAMQ